MFKLKEKKAKFTTEIIAGLTTFFTMAYIIFVNPQIIGGGDATLQTSLFVATCLSAFFGTLLMALLANIPFAQAPGMGLNAFFAYTVMAAYGYSYAEALAIVFISGLLFILITAVGLRELIVKAIPKNIKLAISVGIGLFIAYIGFQNVGFIVNNDSTLTGLGSFKDILSYSPVAFNLLIAVAGLIIIGVLSHFRVPGAILLGMIGTSVIYWIIGLPMGFASLPAASIDFSTIGSQFATWFNTSFGIALRDGMIGLFSGKNFLETLLAVFVIVLSFSFVDMFDTIGTLIGTATKAKMLDENGDLPEMKRAMFADSIATAVGAIFGTSTVTTFVESSSGIAAGGRTGLSSLVTAICFLAALVLAPFTGYIPTPATGAAIIFVGVLMMSSVKEIEWDNITEALPAFLCIVTMPLGYSIADGIFVGIISHAVLNLCSLRFKKISVLEIILAALFVLKYLFV